MGLTPQTAFASAIERMGAAYVLNNEFKKVGQSALGETMKLKLKVGGAMGVLIGLSVILPALAQYWIHGAMTDGGIFRLLLGIALYVGGSVMVFLKPEARKV